MPTKRPGTGPPRVLYTSYYGDLDGGGELRMLDHIRHSSLPREAFAVLTCKPGDLVSHLAAFGVEAHVVPWSWRLGPRRRLLRLPTTLVRIARCLRRIKPDLVVCNTYLDLLLVAPVCALFRVPVVWRSRAEAFPHLGPDRRARTRLLVWFLKRYVAAILPTTRYDRDLMVDAGVPAPRVTVIPNGVNLEAYREAAGRRPALRDEFQVPEDVPLLGMVGRLTALKGHLEFLQALRIVRRAHPRVLALIVGDTAEEPEYRDLLGRTVQQLTLESCVRLAGFRTDVPSIMSALDIFVLASRTETFGTAVIEAMAAGRPVVATRTRGPLETIEDGVTGILVPVGSPEALARAIVDLLEDPAKAAALGRAAQARVGERFDLLTTIRRLDATCLEVLGPRSAGRRSGRGAA